MRIINVVTIKNNLVNDIESFLIHQDHLTFQVSEKAEQSFISKALQLGLIPFSQKDYDDILNNGCFENDDNESVCLSWSSI